MLYIISRTNQGQKQERDWHVGEPLPIDQHTEQFDEIVELQMDGHELELIQEINPNFPFPEKRVIRVFGEAARFLYATIPAK